MMMVIGYLPKTTLAMKARNGLVQLAGREKLSRTLGHKSVNFLTTLQQSSALSKCTR